MVVLQPSTHCFTNFTFKFEHQWRVAVINTYSYIIRLYFLYFLVLRQKSIFVNYNSLSKSKKICSFICINTIMSYLSKSQKNLKFPVFNYKLEHLTTQLLIVKLSIKGRTSSQCIILLYFVIYIPTVFPSLSIHLSKPLAQFTGCGVRRDRGGMYILPSMTFQAIFASFTICMIDGNRIRPCYFMQYLGV